MESVFLDIRTRSSFANASQVTRENAVKQVIMWPANADIFGPVFACLRHKEYVTFRAQTTQKHVDVYVNCSQGGLPYERDGDARQKFWIKPLKETNLGVSQPFFDPSSWETSASREVT